MKCTIKGMILAASMLLTGQAVAGFTVEDANKLDAEASAALIQFKSETKGAEEFLKQAKGILICPKITKAGLIIGGEGGECVMQVEGKTVEYYTNHAAKFGLVAGIQWYALILVFNDQKTLDSFRTGKRDFEIGVDASVALAKLGAGGTLDTTNLKSAIVAFTFGERGFMGDLSLQGSTFKKMQVDFK